MKRSKASRAARPPIRLGAVALIAAVAVALAACSGTGAARSTSTKTASGKVGDNLTVQFLSTPISLDPAKTGIGPSSIYISLAYEPLIFKSPQGTYQPDLATKWAYTNASNTAFQVTLRDGAKFADGTPVTTAAVKASVEYFVSAKGPQSGDLANLTSIQTTADTVDFHFSAPTPNLQQVFSQVGLAGQIISPAGLKDPSRLQAVTAGAGQYVLNTAKTVTGEKYVYDANPNYWNPSAIHYASITVQGIADPNAILSAARTGQVDVALNGSSSTAAAAKSAGLEIVTAPYVWSGLLILDRAGSMVPALGDEKVRQAINYAIDRAALTKAIIGAYGAPTDQVLTPHAAGALSGTTYPYDLAKAKSLMKEAGYEKGFSLTVSDTPLLDPNTTLGQALASELAKIGITVSIESASTIQQFRGDLMNKKYAATVWSPLGAIGMLQFASTYMTPDTTFNPFGSTDAELAKSLQQAASASDAARAQYLEAAQKRVLELGWFAPVYWSDELVYVGKKVTNVQLSDQNNIPDPVAPTKDGGWQPAG